MTQIDYYFAHGTELDSPARYHAAIVPSDTTDLPVRPRVIYCVAGGTVALRDGNGVDLSYTLYAGDILPLSPVRVLATGTTATVYGWW